VYYGKIKFNTLPDIGFAIAHYSESYHTTYGSKKNSIEVAYINSGAVRLTLNGKDMYAPEGSVIVIFRQLPVSTNTVGEDVQSHYTVLAEFENCELTLCENGDNDGDGLVVPFVTPPCRQTEEIGRRLCKIASDMAVDREKNALEASLSFLEILHMISNLHRLEEGSSGEAYRRISDEVKRYVQDNCDKKITLQYLAEQIEKSPNHIGRAFREHNGMTIAEYINSQKIKRAAQLMEKENLSFPLVCEKVGIQDETYGYRLFKKYMGLTPRQFAAIQKIDRNRRQGEN